MATLNNVDNVLPILPAKCTWKVGTKEKCIHNTRPMAKQEKTYANILETVGATPLVKLNKIPQSEGIKCDMYVKCEFFNPGGSVKDRIGFRMIQDAEDKGIIKPGYTIIEPTSGNTGISLALACAVKGYRCIIVMPDRMTVEKEYIARAIGAEIVRTPCELPFDSPDSLFYVAKRLEKEIPNSIVMGQFLNPSNPLSHYDGTAEEIMWQLDNKVDMIVCGPGTGGTITGIGRKIKERLPNCKMVGVDPYGSLIARPESINKTDVKSFEVEGIGFIFSCTVLDHSIVDTWVKITDKETYNMSRRLIAEEGLLVGGSCGAIMAGALKKAKELKEGQRCVVIMPDGIRNYLTNFVSDNWMEARNFKEIENKFNFWWWDIPISELKLPTSFSVKSNIKFAEAIETMKKNNVRELVVNDAETGELIGVVGQDALITQIISMNRQPDKVEVIRAVNRRVIRINMMEKLGKLARVVETEPFVLIVEKEGDKDIFKALITKMDVMSYITDNKATGTAIENNVNKDQTMPANKTYETPKDFVDPGLPSKCTWKLGTTEKSPHTQRPIAHRQKITPDILHVIGCTPLVKLNNIPKSEGIKCEMYAKCEFLNPGGSVKDRIGYRMVQDAEEMGLLKPGCTIIEPTSGNTGIGIALACAVKGYKCLIVMPDKMSNEKVYALRSLGAKIIRTPIEAAYDAPEGLICVAQRLEKEIPNSIVLDQYRNASNPLAHYDGTAAEILWQLDNNVDMIICTAGTAGTISGLGRKIKEEAPNCKVVGVDPYGSILARPESLNKSDVQFYEVEGIGYDFIPTVTDHSVVDVWTKVSDKDCFPMSKRLNAEEGLLCGGSSGGAMFAALKFAKTLEAGQRCVVILPDGIRNYMTKFVSDNWMEARGFKEVVNEQHHWWWDTKLEDLKFSKPITIKSDTTVSEAVEILKKHQLNQVVVLSAENDSIMGVVGQETLINQIVSMSRKPTDPAIKALNKRPIRLTSSDILGKLARVVEVDPCVLIVDKEGDKEVLKGLATKLDVMSFITKSNSQKNGDEDTLKGIASNLEGVSITDAQKNGSS
ncbi:uncharacterized protein LOC119667149 [Teleopsis dalmanni]|uniref:uncharacterized protein LOC119667149 n=1 Tax=Teleopsis dalmanni TaxID=139649 RepID=UPI0018CC8E67|nr:uncharacterized protein LOC119667149 [Teleopsis dalmanni]